MNTLGKEIEGATTEQGLFQKEVAEAVGVSPQYITDIIKNRRVPSDEVLDRLIKYLSLNRNYAYYLVNRYPPEIRGNDLVLTVLDKALNWITHPHDFILRKAR